MMPRPPTSRPRESPQKEDLRLLQVVLAGGARKDADRLCRRLNPTVQLASARVLERFRQRRSLGIADLVQEVWLSLFSHDARKLRLYDPERAELRAYVYRIARNAACDILRVHAPGEVVAGTEEPEVLEARGVTSMHGHARVDHRLELEILMKQIELQTSPTQWSAFVRRVVDGASAEEVAREAGVPKGTVHQWVARTRKLARALAGIGREKGTP